MCVCVCARVSCKTCVILYNNCISGCVYFVTSLIDPMDSPSCFAVKQFSVQLSSSFELLSDCACGFGFYLYVEVLRPEPAFAESLAGKKVVAPRQSSVQALIAILSYAWMLFIHVHPLFVWCTTSCVAGRYFQ